MVKEEVVKEGNRGEYGIYDKLESRGSIHVAKVNISLVRSELGYPENRRETASE